MTCQPPFTVCGKHFRSATGTRCRPSWPTTASTSTCRSGRRRPHAARVDIVKRLKIGIEPLAGYVNHDGLLVTNGVDAMYEHSETWTWKSGETAVLPFVTVHRVIDGKITLWKDYWDMGTLTAQAPAGWLETLMTADMSWVFDATGVI